MRMCEIYSICMVISKFLVKIIDTFNIKTKQPVKCNGMCLI